MQHEITVHELVLPSADLYHLTGYSNRIKYLAVNILFNQTAVV